MTADLQERKIDAAMAMMMATWQQQKWRAENRQAQSLYNKRDAASARLMWTDTGHVGTAALGSPVERSSTHSTCPNFL